jgi:hypothetical protein
MTERSSGQGRPDDWPRGYAGERYPAEQYPADQYPADQYAAGQARGEPYYGAGSGGPGIPTTPIQQSSARQAADPGNRQAPDPVSWQAPDLAGQQAADSGGWQAADPEGWQAADPASWQAAGSGSGQPGDARRLSAADSRGFLSALFDFSFTSFVTTRIIRVLYVLILILTVLSAFVFTISMFRVSSALGLVTLIVGDPLFIVIVMAFWRLVLESFVVVFRIAEDTRAMRERGESS